MTQIDVNWLVGKKIKKVSKVKIAEDDTRFYDDESILKLEFSDGTSCNIKAGYGDYTGKSVGEYPAFIFITDIDEGG